jgi:hypothetical protein
MHFIHTRGRKTLTQAQKQKSPLSDRSGQTTNMGAGRRVGCKAESGSRIFDTPQEDPAQSFTARQ